jgi:hypothetical protein
MTPNRIWSPDQRYCTAWGIAAILAFVAMALYLDHTGMSRILLKIARQALPVE